MNTVLYFYAFLLIFLLKVAISVFIYFSGNDFFGGGNDSTYYHAYAIGETDVITSAWPVFLRWLNELGVYSREFISFCLKLIGFIVIPLLVARLAWVRKSLDRQRVYWAAIVVISAYPTLLYYTTDIYRDVIMVALWLLGVFIFRELSSEKRLFHKTYFFVFGLAVAYLLLEFRGYLGFSYFFALVLAPLYSFRRYPFIFSIFIFLAGLFGFYLFGLLEPVLAYRSIFSDYQTGGSNLGISFSSVIQFFPDLLLSVVYQLFGVYFTGISSVAVFLTESLPFIFLITYVIRNRKYSTKFVDYLIVFFVTYSIIWLLGNDNLGTAVRLRMFSYISILIAFFVIYQTKKIVLCCGKC
ncbi:hypothetical protein [Simiduia litorea]|uniref:hypothetical protein n=1 Tax=Simiduia litorea TaxID=1435348 RepID=UPI0036F2F3B2